VPDFYQGTELWDLSLVDPDNRRPVDFGSRTSLLAQAQTNPDVDELLTNWTDGRIKLFLTTTGLQLRRQLPHVFVGGDYLPLTIESSVPGDAVGFVRASGNDAVLVIASRLCSHLGSAERPVPLGGDSWKTSRILLPDTLRNRTFRNAFTGGEIRLTTQA
jgi:(1->4)-alpha-D-glucan 1-alpha-D-glucosylmutase